MEDLRMNNDYRSDTIAAIATPAGYGGVGIIRISGERAEEVMEILFTPHRAQEARDRFFRLGYLHSSTGELLDEALVVIMRAPHSYTAEDVVEFQCHGGPMMLRRILSCVLACGVRLADPGEFTLRAYLNGRIDLTQAEAVLDLIEAKTADTAALAVGQLAGSLSSLIEDVETKLLNILASITAALDFPDEVDAPETKDLIAGINSLQTQISTLLSKAQTGRIYREGIDAALIGAVNAGKSSLLNALLQEERAIVSASPGTTRDVIEEYLNIEGLPVRLSDTAGLRTTAGLDEAEEIGINRSRKLLENSQLVLCVIDASVSVTEDLLSFLPTLPKQSLVALNKADIATEAQLQLWQQAVGRHQQKKDILIISTRTGRGLDELKHAIWEKACQGISPDKSSHFLLNLRHQQSLLRAQTALAEAASALEAGLPMDLARIDLDNAWQELGELRGKTASEDLLENIFHNFCLGK